MAASILFSKEISDYVNSISSMMNVTPSTALSYGVLLKTVERLPFETWLHFDKINGRWIFTNTDDSVFLVPGRKSEDHNVSGDSFSFGSQCPDLAMARGINYWYHRRIKE